MITEYKLCNRIFFLRTPYFFFKTYFSNARFGTLKKIWVRKKKMHPASLPRKIPGSPHQNLPKSTKNNENLPKSTNYILKHTKTNLWPPPPPQTLPKLTKTLQKSNKINQNLPKPTKTLRKHTKPYQNQPPATPSSLKLNFPT